MTDAANAGIGKLNEVLHSDQFKKVLPYLLTGGAGAAAGAYLTGNRRKRQGEGRLGHLGRVLRNALVTGGLAAGATGLARYSADKLDAQNKPNQAPAMNNPADAALRGTLFHPATAAAAGGLGLWATDRLPGIGAGRKGQGEALEEIRKAINIPDGTDKDGAPKFRQLANDTALKAVAPAKLSDYLAKSNLENPDKLRRLAGLTTGKQIQGTTPYGPSLKSILSPSNWAGAANKAKDFATNPQSPGRQSLSGLLQDLKSQVGRESRRVQVTDALKNMMRSPNAQAAGESTRQLGSKILRRGFSTLGQTGGRRGVRVGVGLASAAIPGLIGAFATPEKTDQ